MSYSFLEESGSFVTPSRGRSVRRLSLIHICIGSFLFIACSEWWLRFLDNSNLYIGDFHLSFMRPGFRKVVFSVIIMAIVLFYRKGLMGDREFSIEGARRFFQKHFKKKQAVEGGSSHE